MRHEDTAHRTEIPAVAVGRSLPEEKTLEDETTNQPSSYASVAPRTAVHYKLHRRASPFGTPLSCPAADAPTGYR